MCVFVCGVVCCCCFPLRVLFCFVYYNVFDVLFCCVCCVVLASCAYGVLGVVCVLLLLFFVVRVVMQTIIIPCVDMMLLWLLCLHTLCV